LGSTVDTVGSALTFSITIQLIVILAANGIAWGLGQWSSQIFKLAFVGSFAPWLLSGVALFRLQWGHLWAALERIANRDLDASGTIGDIPVREDIRVVPVYGAGLRTTDQVDRRDLKTFVRTICSTKDWTQTTWRGKQMPSGKTCDNDYHAQLVAPLVKIRAIQGYGPRVTGFLAVDDAGDICERLGL